MTPERCEHCDAKLYSTAVQTQLRSGRMARVCNKQCARVLKFDQELEMLAAKQARRPQKLVPQGMY